MGSTRQPPRSNRWEAPTATPTAPNAAKRATTLARDSTVVRVHLLPLLSPDTAIGRSDRHARPRPGWPAGRRSWS